MGVNVVPASVQRYIDIRCAVLKVDDVPIPAQ